MLFTAQQIAYRDTHAFSKVALDYVEGKTVLQSFIEAAPTEGSIQKAIEKKQQQPVDRATLVRVLKEQYAAVEPNAAVSTNIKALLSPDTFTICTAHQPNLFTGPIFFIYKILHAIQLADVFKKKFPQYKFVPVYYMGSEDADKEELLHTYLNGKRYEWQTKQTGAVGRMKIDAAVVKLIDEMAGQLHVYPFGKEITQQLYDCYTVGKDLQVATFQFVHGLFKKFGLVVLIPDNGLLKKLMLPVFEADLFEQASSAIVDQTCQRLSEHYNVQANPREINLFYLAGGIRNRIVKQGDSYVVHETAIRFTEAELRNELQEHPERFSPNVILRGLFQETILPNLVFVGGGGELAYWLQLKDLFRHYGVPYPVLVLRNSFLIIEKKWKQRLQKWDLSDKKLFETELQILNSLLAQEGKLPQLNGEVEQIVSVYEDLKKLAGSVDVTLNKHVEALKTRTLQQLQNLEKKMMRTERKKHQALQHQVQQLKQALFPMNNLQERVENFSSFYAKWGTGFIDDLLQHSLTLEQQFTTLTEA